MSEHNFTLLFLSIYVFISLIGVSSTQYLPVILWETTQYSEVVPALGRVSPESFKNILTERALKKAPIVVFAEENLSSEDFALRDSEGKTPFTHLSIQKESAQVSYWPSVFHPLKVVKELPERRSVIETSINSILNDQSFVLHDDDVLVIDLNDAREGEDRLQMLKRHDKDIAAVYERFAKEDKDFLSLYTGRHPSWITSEELRSHRRIRDTGNPSTPKPIAEETEEPYRMYNTSDVLIYVDSTPILSYNGTIVSFDSFETVKTTTKNDTDLLVQFSSAEKKDITVTFSFKFSLSKNWNLTTIIVNNDSLPEQLGKEYHLRTKDVYAPFGFSYHCNTTVFYNGSNIIQNLTLPGLQIQPFPIGTTNKTGTDRFGDAYDCVGFTSAPIWSGLFVTFILALIMTFGLTMMMDIKTMDRFDDPKGKTITIGAIE